MKRARTFITGIFYLFLLGSGFAQSTLTITANAGYNPPYNLSTGYNIDSVMGENSGCYLDNRLYIFIVDTPSFVSPSCEPWATNYAGLHPGHDFGNILGCRARPEYYFQYDQSDPDQMQSLDSLINIWIPDGYIFGIYSWVAYDYPAILSSSPSLANTLFSYWGIQAATFHTAAIFYAIKGDPATYDMVFTDNSADTVQMVKQICQSLFPIGMNNEPQEQLRIYPNSFTDHVTIEGIVGPTQMQIHNMLGEVIGSWMITSDKTTIQTGELVTGIYFLSFHKGDQVITKKIIKK